jgi:hypothetical protein
LIEKSETTTLAERELHYEDDSLPGALMMEAVSTSETSVNFYVTTRRNTPEGCYLHTRRRESLKSHINYMKPVQRVEHCLVYLILVCSEDMLQLGV